MIAFESKKQIPWFFLVVTSFFVETFDSDVKSSPIFRLFEIQLFDIGKDLPIWKSNFEIRKVPPKTLILKMFFGDNSATLLWENSRWAVKIPVTDGIIDFHCYVWILRYLRVVLIIHYQLTEKCAVLVVFLGLFTFFTQNYPGIFFTDLMTPVGCFRNPTTGNRHWKNMVPKTTET